LITFSKDPNVPAGIRRKKEREEFYHEHARELASANHSNPTNLLYDVLLLSPSNPRQLSELPVEKCVQYLVQSIDLL